MWVSMTLRIGPSTRNSIYQNPIVCCNTAISEDLQPWCQDAASLKYAITPASLPWIGQHRTARRRAGSAITSRYPALDTNAAPPSRPRTLSETLVRLLGKLPQPSAKDLTLTRIPGRYQPARTAPTGKRLRFQRPECDQQFTSTSPPTPFSPKRSVPGRSCPGTRQTPAGRTPSNRVNHALRLVLSTFPNTIATVYPSVGLAPLPWISIS